MVPFWIPIIIRSLIFRVPKKRTIILTTTHMYVISLDCARRRASSSPSCSTPPLAVLHDNSPREVANHGVSLDLIMILRNYILYLLRGDYEIFVGFPQNHNKIPIYPIVYLRKGDLTPRPGGLHVGSILMY